METTKCPLINKYIKKMWCLCTGEYYYTVFKKKGILTHATTLLCLEDIMLNEIN